MGAGWGADVAKCECALCVVDPFLDIMYHSIVPPSTAPDVCDLMEYGVESITKEKDVYYVTLDNRQNTEQNSHLLPDGINTSFLLLLSTSCFFVNQR